MKKRSPKRPTRKIAKPKVRRARRHRDRRTSISFAEEQLTLGRRLFDDGRRDEALDPLARAFLLAGRSLFGPSDQKYLKVVLSKLKPPLGFRSWNAYFRAEDSLPKIPEPSEDEVVDGLLRKHGKTSLHAAIEAGDETAVRRSILAGVDVNARWKQGRIVTTPLHSAAFADAPTVVRLLLDAGATVEPKKCGQSPLHVARSVAVAKLLLDAGADLEACDTEGRTPLWRAIDCVLPLELARLYVESGANLSARAYGKSLLQIAQQNNDKLAAYLRARGAR